MTFSNCVFCLHFNIFPLAFSLYVYIFRCTQYQEQGSDVCDDENFTRNGHGIRSGWSWLSTLLPSTIAHVQRLQNI